MILCYFLKLLTEMSLYFVCCNCFIAISGVEIDSFWPAIICAIVGTLAYCIDEKNSSLRYVALPLLLAVFLFAKGFGTAIMLFLPVFYIALCIHKRRFFVDAASQSDIFKFGMALAFVVYFLFAVFIGVRWVVPFIMMFLFVNMFLMRLLRQNPAYLNDKRFLLSNAAQLGVALAVTALLTTDVIVENLKKALLFVYHLFVDFLVNVLFRCGYALYYFFYEILYANADHDSTKKLDIGGGGFGEEFFAAAGDELSYDNPIVLFLQILCLVVGVILIILYVRSRRQGRNTAEGSTARVYRRAVTELRPEEKAPIDLVAPKENRDAVKFYYRKFLRLCKKLEYKFPLSFTSKQIEDGVSREFGRETPQTIRQIYIRARYSDKEITEADVAVMKEQVDSLKDKFEPKKTDKK